jgi:sulfate permease, SulP family
MTTDEPLVRPEFPAGSAEEPLVHTRLPAGSEGDVDQPGLSTLRTAVTNRARRALGPASIRQDALAGLNSALSSVPDGMASGLLAGVNPIHGLYACMAGPVAGGLLSSSRLMVVTTTSAAALGAGEALARLPLERRDGGLMLLAVMIGAFQLLLGAFGLGRLTRFVSFSVMTGFVCGIAVRTILTQLDTVTGFQSTGDNHVVRAINLLVNVRRFDPATVGSAVFTAVLIATLPRTRLGSSGTLVAIAVPSLLVLLFKLSTGMSTVQIVRDVGQIPRGIPTPGIPRLSDLSLELVLSALAIALVILVQGAGVSQSVPNPDRSERNPSRDFFAQGAANIASGFFRGLPVGGSLSTTAISVTSGARSRWAAVFAGLMMAAVVVIFPALVSHIVMPALAALLIFASATTIKPDRIRSIWVAGAPSIIAASTTFIGTLFLPIQAAVGIGTALSAVLYVYTSSGDVSVVELIERENGDVVEVPPDPKLRSNRVTVLDVYGSLFYAGARTLERLLPLPQGSQNAVVILRLRGRTSLGATLTDVLAGYAERLAAAGGRLYLSGLHPDAFRELAGWKGLDLKGPVRAFEVTPVVGESTRAAHADADAWLIGMSRG